MNANIPWLITFFFFYFFFSLFLLWYSTISSFIFSSYYILQSESPLLYLSYTDSHLYIKILLSVCLHLSLNPSFASSSSLPLPRLEDNYLILWTPRLSSLGTVYLRIKITFRSPTQTHTLTQRDITNLCLHPGEPWYAIWYITFQRLLPLWKKNTFEKNKSLKKILRYAVDVIKVEWLSFVILINDA